MEFKTAKSVAAKMMAYLPNADDFMDLQTYNKLYVDMIKNQTNDKGETLPQKAQLEEQHKELRSNILKTKLNEMKKNRNKK
jgi:hypothetical protein